MTAFGERLDVMGFNRGPRASLGEAVSSGFTSAYTMGSVAENRRHAEVYGGWRQVFDRVIQGYVALPPDLGRSVAEQGFAPDEETLGRLVSWAQEASGQYDFEITPAMDPAAVMRRRDEVYARDQAIVEREQEVLSRASPFSRNVGGLIGGVGAEFLDPVNMATLPIGAPIRAGLLGTMLIEGGINAAIEAVDTPNRNAIAERLGQEGNSVLENAAFGFVVGGAFAGVIKGAQLGASELARIGRLIPDRRALIEVAEATGDAEAGFIAQQLRSDIEDEHAATDGDDRDQVREHMARSQAAAEAAQEGVLPDMPDRPTFAQPRPTLLSGQLQEFTPDELTTQADVFQWKTDVVDEAGVRGVLRNQTRFDPTLAGPVFIYQRENGVLVVVDGHQRTDLAKRAQAAGQDVRMSGYVYREVDGWTPEEVYGRGIIADLSQREQFAADMVRDAARALRVSPELVRALPQGPGHKRLQRILALPDEAFDAVINRRLDPNIAEMIPMMVESPEMQNAVARLLVRLEPETAAQAQSIIAQAREAPVNRESITDLFGESAVTESLYLERAKVLERAMRIMRDDRSVFRTLDGRAERIEGTGANRLDTETNKQTRQQVEQAVAAVPKLAHRAGPISEALNDGAKAYKETGRLKDAAARVVEAVRSAIQRDGLRGLDAGTVANDGSPALARPKAPDPLEAFADPVSGEGVQAQIAATRIEPDGSDDFFDAVPVGRGFDDEGNEIAIVKSRAELAAELDADDAAVAVLDLCVKG